MHAHLFLRLSVNFNVLAELLMVCQGNRIKIIMYIDREDVEEPCKGDTPA